MTNVLHTNATIERCAQVADAQAYVEECADDTARGHVNAAPYRKIAAAIRKLKDSNTDPNIIHPGSDHPGPFPQEEP